MKKCRIGKKKIENNIEEEKEDEEEKEEEEGEEEEEEEDRSRAPAGNQHLTLRPAIVLLHLFYFPLLYHLMFSFSDKPRKDGRK
ncbi:hypothetical protein E2C01_096471 [Portunus trituberculatus]|uniref:Uncharacterized protein n=1 Tax=Portunus trituberculatus TaxID=210409 RepID=A0A5B7K2V4_PORTR|nr:hypothetical protein [Portunus trituberculatus]